MRQARILATCLALLAAVACKSGSAPVPESPPETYGSVFPAAPTGVSASQGTAGTTIELRWSKVQGAVDYVIAPPYTFRDSFRAGNVDHWVDGSGVFLRSYRVVAVDAQGEYGEVSAAVTGWQAPLLDGAGAEGAPLWPGDYNGPRTGSMSTRGASGPYILWEMQLNDGGMVQPPTLSVADDGTLYLQDWDGAQRRLLAVGPDGVVRWDIAIEPPLFSATLDNAGHLRFRSGPGVFRMSPMGAVTQLATSRESVFHYVLMDDRVLLGEDEYTEGDLQRMEDFSGNVLWRIAKDSNAEPPPIVNRALALPGGRVLVQYRAGTLAALDAASGALLWSLDSAGGIHLENTFITSDGGLILSTGEYSGDALVVSSAGEVLQELPDLLPAALDGATLIATSGGYDRESAVVALDANTFAEKWRVPNEGLFGRPVLDSQGRVYFTTQDGILHCINVNGNESWRTQPIFYSAATIVPGGEGRIYVLDTEGKLACFDDNLGAEITAPTGVEASAGTYDGAIRVTWQPVPRATAYTLRRDGQLLAETVLETSYVDRNLVPGEPHTYDVRARAAGLNSLFSEDASGSAGGPYPDPFWPSRSGGSQNRRRAAAVGPADPELAWTYQITGYIGPGDYPLVDGRGQVYFSDHDELVCILPDGREGWRLRNTWNLSFLVSGGTIFAPTYGSPVQAIAPYGLPLDPPLPFTIPYLHMADQKGNLYWADTGGGDPWKPATFLIAQSISELTPVSFAADSPSVLAVAANDGILATIGAQAAAENYHYYSVERALAWFNPDGSEKWRFDPLSELDYSADLAGADFTNIVVNANNMVYAVGFVSITPEAYYRQASSQPPMPVDAGRLWCIDANGALLWETDLGTGASPLISQVMPALAADGGLIFTGSDDTYRRGIGHISPAGELTWLLQYPYNEGVHIVSLLIDAEDNIYFATGEHGEDAGGAVSLGFVASITPQGAERWRFKMPRLLPIYDTLAMAPDGTLIVGSDDDRIYAIRERK